MVLEKKKEFTYKGKTIEDLKKLDVREFAKLVPSRSRRSILRNFQEHEDFISRAKKKNEKGKQIKTHSRQLVIVPGMVGMKLQVHNGKNFVPFEVTGEMLSHRMGEFSLTRNKVAHTKSGVGATKGTRAKSKK